MPKAGDDPHTWRLPFHSAQAQQLGVRDIVETIADLPHHRGFEYAVDIAAANIDEAADQAAAWAESVALMLAAVSRSPVGPLHRHVAYEITPGVAEREFRQWFWDPSLPVGKPVVSRATFGELRQRIDELSIEGGGPSKTLWRAVLSISWFRQALEETDALFRFLKLWIAIEALNPLLDEHYHIPNDERSGFQGLRCLADEHGRGSDWISAVLGLRRDLFHGLRVRPADLRSRANQMTGGLEDLSIAAWKLLLQLEELYPPTSIVPHRLQIKLHAIVHHLDESAWDVDHHPRLEGRTQATFDPNAPPREVSFTLSSTYTVHNADGIRIAGHEMWGPSGHAPLTVHQTKPGAEGDDEGSEV